MTKERKTIRKEKVPGLLVISKNSWRREEVKRGTLDVPRIVLGALNVLFH